jgi:hypothetical protein
MKKTVALVVVAAIAVVLVATYVSRAGEESNPLRASIGSDQYDSCGLNKLSGEEAKQLFRFMHRGGSYSFLEESAIRYMEKEGWRRIEVVGAQFDAGSATPRKRLIVLDRYDMFTLEPWSGGDLPYPGLYWAKKSLSSWNMMYPDGTVHDFNEVK